MRIIIELDDEKQLTLNPAEKGNLSGNFMPAANNQPIEAVDGGAAPMGQSPVTENAALTTSDATIIDGGSAPMIPTS
ncbi:hypothetical protein [uncultured Fibrella sp.]|uniref:hypothetical protein n=1 Tax=uncultured Fibrella sp. TaxID=1284596 RepID=UPI0035CC464E